ncbi:hypothetical protein [Dehalogenimonas sp. 4OHTPN]|uniref:Dehalogenase n=1 Tax=Dehalogenimonas sp. 4OHTPN TaxID=3166643 RepID=A0AAU8GCJ9_9CHLR
MSLLVFLGGIVLTVLVGLIMMANKQFRILWWHYILVAGVAVWTAIGVVITFDLAIERAQGAWLVALIFGLVALIVAIPTVRSVLHSKKV